MSSTPHPSRLPEYLAGLYALLIIYASLESFSAWMAPAGGIAWAEKERRTSVLTGLAVFVTNLVFKSFSPLLHGAPRALMLVHARNLLLAFLAFDAARRLARAPLTMDSEPVVPTRLTT